MQTSNNIKDLIGTFGARLREERKRLGYTQEDFGQCGGVTRLTQSKYEASESAPDMLYLMNIETIGVDLTYLFSGEKSIYTNGDDLHGKQANLVFEVVEEVEKIIKLQGTILSPEKKARLISTIYRNSNLYAPINKKLIFDFLNLAAE